MIIGVLSNKACAPECLAVVQALNKWCEQSSYLKVALVSVVVLVAALRELLNGLEESGESSCDEAVPIKGI